MIFPTSSTARSEWSPLSKSDLAPSTGAPATCAPSARIRPRRSPAPASAEPAPAPAVGKGRAAPRMTWTRDKAAADKRAELPVAAYKAEVGRLTRASANDDDLARVLDAATRLAQGRERRKGH